MVVTECGIRKVTAYNRTKLHIIFSYQRKQLKKTYVITKIYVNYNCFYTDAFISAFSHFYISFYYNFNGKKVESGLQVRSFWLLEELWRWCRVVCVQKLTPFVAALNTVVGVIIWVRLQKLRSRRNLSHWLRCTVWSLWLLYIKYGLVCTYTR